jgi:hypothetical protein
MRYVLILPIPMHDASATNGFRYIAGTHDGAGALSGASGDAYLAPIAADAVVIQYFTAPADGVVAVSVLSIPAPTITAEPTTDAGLLLLMSMCQYYTVVLPPLIMLVSFGPR